MRRPVSLLPELEEAIQRGSPAKRAETLRRITDLFVDGASRFGPDHVGLFDDVMGYLIAQIETRALEELANRIAPVPNAPEGVVRKLAASDEIAVAGPILRLTPLEQHDLEFIAGTKSQAHLLAMSQRADLGRPVTDILVRRGDGPVVHTVTTNARAPLSAGAMTALVQRARIDGGLAEKIGQRTDIPPDIFRQLVTQATDVVRERLMANARPEIRVELGDILEKASVNVRAKAPPRDYAAALERVRLLQAAGKLNEAAILEFAKTGQHDDTVAALSTLCAVPIVTVERLVAGNRSDPVIILARAANLKWDTVRAAIESWPDGRGLSPDALATAKQNYEVLSPATAERVVRFWQVRPKGDR